MLENICVYNIVTGTSHNVLYSLSTHEPLSAFMHHFARPAGAMQSKLVCIAAKAGPISTAADRQVDVLLLLTSICLCLQPCIQLGVCGVSSAFIPIVLTLLFWVFCGIKTATMQCVMSAIRQLSSITHLCAHNKMW